MRKIINLERFIKNKSLREWIEALIFAVIVALIFRTWIFAPYRVPTGSMIHTIEIGDHLFVNKFAYGLIIPFTDTKIFSSEVERGDVVVFPYPVNPDVNFIKRVIGVGGDTIELIGENIYINGKLEKEEFVFLDDSIYTVAMDNKIEIPEGKLFVMGDNRRNSKDSRYWGFVDEKKVEGKGAIIYWNHNPNSSLLSGYRLDRIGTIMR